MPSTNRTRTAQPPPGDVTGPQLLAAAIITQAIRDLNTPDLPSAVRDQARTFLRGTEGFRFWCAVAGLEWQTVSDRALRDGRRRNVRRR